MSKPFPEQTRLKFIDLVCASGSIKDAAKACGASDMSG